MAQQKEASILRPFLLTPASLVDIIPVDKFAELFPRSQRSSPQIQQLYHELQFQRAQVLEQVKKNTDAELRRGQLQRREVVRMRRKADREELGFDSRDARELEMETELLGPTMHLPQRNPHSLSTLLPELESTCSDLESQIANMEARTETALSDIEDTVDNLSDLRYGKLRRTSGSAQDIGQDVLEGITNLQRACDDVEKT